MKKVLLLSTGGTIGQVHDKDNITHDAGAATAETFRAVLDHLAKTFGLQLSAKVCLNKDSSNIIMDDWKTIVNAIVEEYDNYDAFIVTHGTNTMGYTCAAVSWSIGNLGKPVAFTGAQVSYGIAGSDTVTNLENTLRAFAERPDLVGVFLVFGSKIITGTRVKKRTEFDYDAFKTFGRGADLAHLGNSIQVNEAALAHHIKHLGTRSKTRSGLDIKANFSTNILSLTEFPGLCGDHIINATKAGIQGFILRGFGAGDPNVAEPDAKYPSLRKAFEFLRQAKIPIVVTTQAPDGVASMAINTPGVLAHKLGAIPAWDMSMESMVTKLSWLIGNGATYEQIQKLFVTSLRGEIDPGK